MPVYFSGWILSNAVARFGTGFTVQRFAPAGAYRIVIPPTATGRFIAATATPAAANLTARIAQYVKQGDGSHWIDIEIRNGGGVLTDSDFTFIAVDRS